MVKWHLVALLVAGFLLASCNNDGDAGDAGDDDDDDTNGDDDDDDDDDDDGSVLTAEVSPDNDVPAYTIEYSSLYGGFTDDPIWVFGGVSNDATTTLAFGFGDPPGVGVREFDTSADPSNAVGYTDLSAFGNYGSFISTVGTIEVTRWEEAGDVVGTNAFHMDGTFGVHLTNALPVENENHVEVEIAGTFSNVLMIEDAGPQ